MVRVCVIPNRFVREICCCRVGVLIDWVGGDVAPADAAAADDVIAAAGDASDSWLDSDVLSPSKRHTIHTHIHTRACTRRDRYQYVHISHTRIAREKDGIV